ncbi:MAG: hypothetical protein IJU55_00425 [Selenomonadaceae bacterium]|nr:hypothetical protein [Selenomonadaceae bacterium]
MNNFIKPIPPLTEEELAEIEALKNMRDDEIDFSDIPEITHEEWVTRFKPARLRRKKLNVAG